MSVLPVDISTILAETGTSLSLEDSVSVDTLVVGAEEFRFLAPPAFTVEFVNRGAGVSLSGEVKARVEVACSRCLEPFELDLVGEVEALFVSTGMEGEFPEEQDVVPIEGGSVDLWPYLQAALALSAPFAPLHDPDCRGICATCGQNLNERTCDCLDVESDSPFAVLGQLIEDESEDPEPG